MNIPTEIYSVYYATFYTLYNMVSTCYNLYFSLSIPLFLNRHKEIKITKNEYQEKSN